MRSRFVDTAWVRFVTLLCCALSPVFAHEIGHLTDPFRQLDEIIPTPTEARLASGAPGPAYWQQKVDYDIHVSLDDALQRLSGSETITYHNNSPHTLAYLWMQLDQNLFQQGSDEMRTRPAPSFDELPYALLKSHLSRERFEGGYTIKSVTTAEGKDIPHTIVGTMMRVDLSEIIKPGGKRVFCVDWEHNIIDTKTNRARGGYEYFDKDKNYIYEMAQWYPRMAAYTDYAGWQHKQFLGDGEFTLEFGDYRVAITAPADHIVAATGELQNADEVLTVTQQKRLEEAQQSGRIHFIVTPEEAKATQSNEHKPSETKTWTFAAQRVRDFAWASSRKFIWDAQSHPVGDKKVWAMSYYPNEAEPLWSKYSTQAVAHTLDVYSKYTFDYPYPVAISVNGPVGGMEYPMICFNGPRPEEDGTYSLNTKTILISVVIHEVGHNYFPMVVNSDERQWTWMDEGLNSFLQFLAECEWEARYPEPWSSAKPRGITSYMAGDNQVPIMTNSESIHQFVNNAYGKPATALNVLRETVMGRDLFDFAFQQYARRWMFKRPEPADLFRTMEDASGIDLDWFWRGWFYTTQHVDIGIKALRLYEIDTRNPDIEKAIQQDERDEIVAKDLSEERNRTLPKLVDRHPELRDFYNDYDPLDVTDKERREYQTLLDGLEDDEKKLLMLRKKFYVVELENLGGLVMPAILQVSFDNGDTQQIHLPAEIWRKNPKQVSRLILTNDDIVRIELDPRLESADTYRQNNFWPPQVIKSRFQLIKEDKVKNAMQLARDEQKRKDEKSQSNEEAASKGVDEKEIE
jgi:hypothetical protein